MISQILKALIPPKKLNVSQWADEYRILSSEASAISGKWNTSIAEYQRGIMDAFSDPAIHTVVWMSSAQVGKTEALLNIIGYFIDQDPSPMLLLQPTLEMATAFSKDRLAPMVRDTTAITSKVSDAKSKDSGNTILHKTFQGGHITMAGANSPASLASRPVRVVLCDEVDRYPPSAGSEGDPVNLAFKRTTTFWNKKRMLTSTPTIKGISRIEQAYEGSDMRKFYVPCQLCKEFQVLAWQNVVYEKNQPSTARYTCCKCGALWNDIEKKEAISKGKWQATSVSDGVAGFWLNELYSPWVSMGDMVSNFLEAKKSVHTLKTFINTSLGETWEEDPGQRIEESELLNRREDYELIPNEALILTCGVDTQDDRLEGEIKAWGVGFESWGVKSFSIEGSPSQKQVWQDLDNIIKALYERQDGIKLKVSCTCIDSGGHFTDQVYKFCKLRSFDRVFAIKGSSVAGRPIISRPSTSNKLGVKLFTIGTDTAKELIYSRLKLSEFGEGYMHFNKTFDEKYFLMLTSEKLVMTLKKGRPVMEWKPIRARNEALDYTVYNLAAISILNPNFAALKENIGHKNQKRFKIIEKPGKRWI
ncbi:phage terminase, large subunit [Campylobacter iguaniorum]|uniref:phage terminase large subunit family protein n=1 Tax=Campylobacter iguaniorum TaxID=1244531 RepID=UPI00073A38CD|nr:phage terminase large subunit family protein [Campylobacter iguaniorum]ALV25050.1 phage terminase, large subunit [Campylobacter iguaniorum]